MLIAAKIALCLVVPIHIRGHGTDSENGSSPRSSFRTSTSPSASFAIYTSPRVISQFCNPTDYSNRISAARGPPCSPVNFISSLTLRWLVGRVNSPLLLNYSSRSI